MTYYTLTDLGREDSPSKHSKTYASLVLQLRENDLPRTVDQILKGGGTEEGIRWLEEKGYFERSKPPKPESPAKIRTPSIEDVAKSDAKRIISQQRYMQSDKFKEAHRKYEQGERGKQTLAKYWKSDKGRNAQRRWRLNRKITEMEAFMKGGNGNRETILREIEKTKKQLAELKR